MAIDNRDPYVNMYGDMKPSLTRSVGAYISRCHMIIYHRDYRSYPKLKFARLFFK